MEQRTEVWTEEELKSIDLHYPVMFPQEFEELVPKLWPGRTPNAAYQLAYRRGLKKERLRILFPKKYDSDLDGGYVSGLTDGEGCFRAAMGTTPKGSPSCRLEFKVDLRDDDQDVLEWLKSYFGVGNIHLNIRDGCRTMASFSVSSLYDIKKAVVPHFDKYPLRAKKQRDFATWRLLSDILAMTYQRPLTGIALRKLERLVTKLTDGRRYQGGA